MKLAAGELERLHDRHNLLDARYRLERLDLQLGLVADHADDGPRNSLAQMGGEPQRGDSLEHVFQNLGRRVRFQYNDHLDPREGTIGEPRPRTSRAPVVRSMRNNCSGADEPTSLAFWIAGAKKFFELVSGEW